MTRVGDVLPVALVGLLPETVIDRRVNWVEVARTDLADARRSWVLWTLGGAFAVLMLLAPLYPLFTFRGDPSELSFFWGPALLSLVIWLLAPLAALLVGAAAVVGEHEAGRLRLLLGFPITRRDVVVGKLLGRSAVLVVTLLVGLVLAAVEIRFVYGPFDLGWYAAFVLAQLGYGLLFVWIGVGISALFRSYARALGAAVSAYALFVPVWEIIPKGVFYLARGQFPGNVPDPFEPPAWLIFLGNANPVNGYFSLVAELPLSHPLGPGVGGTLHYYGRWYWGYSIEPPGPFYLQPEFLLVVMLAWVIVPLLLGSWRFSRCDLA